MKIGGGHFAPKLGGHFELESGGHFKLELGGQYHWNLQFTKEGLGIRSTARILKISTTTLLKRIIAIAKKIPNQPIFKHKTYEVDEIRTFVKNKE